jgi:hypothetical protein
VRAKDVSRTLYHVLLTSYLTLSPARPAALRASTALRKAVLRAHGRQRSAHGEGAHEELV